MFGIVAQNILQFNQGRCQDDNLFNQIDIKRPRGEGNNPARPVWKVLIETVLTAAAASGRGGRLLRFDVLLSLQKIEGFFG